MIDIKKGKVVKINNTNDDIEYLLVNIDGNYEKTINYIRLTGKANLNDIVYVNTTAVKLSLGTGGYHYVILNINVVTNKESYSKGHIMKLRYTPLQFKCYSIEEVPKYKNTVFQEKANLRKMPVIICSLHSMIVLASVAAKNYYKKNIKITYVMTDGGSLPISFSKIVKKLKSSNLIDKTITVGHSFGGDIEAVNIYTGLIAAKSIINSDITIVSMGPGIVGTSTKYGFTGIEQGEIVNAVSSINGRPIVIPRISFMDTRIRHKGISHHTLTTLKEIALKSAYLTIHKMEKSKLLYVFKQLNENNIIKKHKIILEDGKPGLNKFKDYSFDVKTMGRNTEVDKDFFLNCSAAGVAALKMIN